MNFMQKEMQEELKKDILSGKIYGLKLIKTPIEAIRNNRYSLMFGEIREIVNANETCFYLKTRVMEPHYLKGTSNGVDYSISDFSIPTQNYVNCEGYYSAFENYDGHILQAISEVPNAVNEKDIAQITEYEVIRGY